MPQDLPPVGGYEQVQYKVRRLCPIMGTMEKFPPAIPIQIGREEEDED